jgi:hypothetical protein
MTKRFHRRHMLGLIGATAAGASLPWLRSPSARAQADEVPLRVLFIEASPGCRRTTFEPVAPGPLWSTATRVETTWAFRDVMAPLTPYRARTTLFQNLDMLSDRADPTSPANAHLGGLTHMLTAANRAAPDQGGGVSIDQRIAQHLRDSGVRTRLSSLEMMATDSAGEYSRSQTHYAYSAAGQQVPFLTYIPDIWERVFPEPLAGDSQAQAQQSARRAHVFNFIRSDYDRLIARLGAEDRDKLTQMRDYRADLQASAGIVTNRDANRPPQASILDPWSQLSEGYQRGNLQNRTWKVHAELIGKLAAAALHTDTTRVVNVSIENPPNYEFGYTNGNFGSSDAHDLTHQVSGDAPMLVDAAAAAVIDESHRVVYLQVRAILDELAALQESDGQSLLDHTLVVVYSHIAEGSHDLTRLPWLLLGDAHGYLRTGLYIRFGSWDSRLDRAIPADDAGFPYTWNGRGRPHNDLFVTIANAMGLPLTTFGNTSVATGPISELIA